MFKKTITYTDYNGVERTEDFYFNITKSELIDLEFKHNGGFTDYLDTIVKAKKLSELKDSFDALMELSYGVKSEDGRRFIKTPELFAEFKESPAYDEMMMQLYTDRTFTSDFANGVLPTMNEKDLKKLKLAGEAAKKSTE